MKQFELRNHPAIADSDLIGTGLCSLPDCHELTTIHVGRQTSEELNSLGIRVFGETHDGNYVLVHRDSQQVNATISFFGSNNYVVLGRTAHFHGKITIGGSRNLFLSCGITSRSQVLNLEIRNDDNAFVAGKEVSWNGVNAIIEGPRGGRTREQSTTGWSLNGPTSRPRTGTSTPPQRQQPKWWLRGGPGLHRAAAISLFGSFRSRDVQEMRNSRGKLIAERPNNLVKLILFNKSDLSGQQALGGNRP